MTSPLDGFGFDLYPKLYSDSIASQFDKKKKTEKEILKPVNVFLLSQKINFLPNQDNSSTELARRSDEYKSTILPAKLANKSLASKSIHWQSEDLIKADQSELKINSPNLQIVGRSDTDFLTRSSQNKL